MAEYDAVIVGSGVNSLACGALLAREGWRVCVLERNDWLGGAIHTAELTEPGFLHDVFSAWHPLWVGGAAHALLGDDLAARALEYLNTDLPTGTAYPDGEAAFLLRDAGGAMRASSGPSGPAYSSGSSRTPTSRSACSAPSSGRRRVWRSDRRRCGDSGAPDLQGSPQTCSRRAATGSSRRFASERAHGLLAPWVLHTGLGPDAATSGFMTQVIAVAVQGREACRARRRREARRGARADSATRGGRARPGRTSSGCSSARGEPWASASPAARSSPRSAPSSPASRRRSSTSACRRERGAGDRGRGAAPLPLRPRRDADPFRALRAGALGG